MMTSFERLEGLFNEDAKEELPISTTCKEQVEYDLLKKIVKRTPYNVFDIVGIAKGKTEFGTSEIESIYLTEVGLEEAAEPGMAPLYKKLESMVCYGNSVVSAANHLCNLDKLATTGYPTFKDLGGPDGQRRVIALYMKR